MSEPKPSQSLSISGGQLSDVQLGLAGHNLTQIKQSIRDTPEQQPTSTEVIELIAQIETLLDGSDLPEDQKKKALKHLDSVKEEAAKEDTEEKPDKDFATKSLQRATKVIKDASETVEASKSLWDKLQPIVTRIIPWLGAAKSIFF